MAIVAAVDRSERAATITLQAIALGESFGEPVKVVHVLTRDEFVSLERSNVNETGRTIPTQDVVRVAEEIAAEAIEVADTTAAPEPVGLLGDPAEEIIEYADANGARYIVVAGRKRSPVGKALFGSVAQSILLNASQPVVSLRFE